MKVFPLSEGTYTVDVSKQFVPFNPAVDQLTHRPASLLVDIVPFLVQSSSDLMVVDPGLGLQDASGEFMIHASIHRLGFNVNDVSKILLSHLHKDHMSGAAYGRNGAYSLMFPRATIYCQERELDYAFTVPNSPSYDFEKLEFIRRSQRLVLLNGNGQVNDETRYEVSGGHSPFHQVFYFGTNEQTYFFGGDVVPQSSQIIRRFVAKYDFDGQLSAQLRRDYAARGAKENWTFLFFHDAKTPMAKLSHEHHRFQIVKV